MYYLSKLHGHLRGPGGTGPDLDRRHYALIAAEQYRSQVAGVTLIDSAVSIRSPGLLRQPCRCTATSLGFLHHCRAAVGQLALGGLRGLPPAPATRHRRSPRNPRAEGQQRRVRRVGTVFDQAKTLTGLGADRLASSRPTSGNRLAGPQPRRSSPSSRQTLPSNRTGRDPRGHTGRGAIRGTYRSSDRRCRRYREDARSERYFARDEPCDAGARRGFAIGVSGKAE